MDKLEIDNYIDLYLEKVALFNFKNSYPNTLSGGIKQRISLTRVFSMPYDILLLDEPFQGLDDLELLGCQNLYKMLNKKLDKMLETKQVFSYAFKDIFDNIKVFTIEEYKKMN